MTLADAIPGLERISGPVTRPGDPDYDAARQTFNGTVDRHPAVIVGCLTVDDVVTAVRAARAAGLSIAVRGGGHGVAGHAMADGALVVDLRRMRSVTVDSAARQARVAGGALWEDVDRATLEHGLATTGGTFVDTGVAGLTLTGGIGHLMGTAGFTCDNVVGAQVVTADGSVVVAGGMVTRNCCGRCAGVVATSASSPSSCSRSTRSARSMPAATRSLSTTPRAHSSWRRTSPEARPAN